MAIEGGARGGYLSLLVDQILEGDRLASDGTGVSTDRDLAVDGSGGLSGAFVIDRGERVDGLLRRMCRGKRRVDRILCADSKHRIDASYSV